MSDKMITITVDGASVLVDSGASLLDACAAAGAKVPTLCHLKDVSSNASCGLCVVEVEGAKSLVRSCVGTISADMKVSTTTPRVMRARRNAVELLLANHPADCLTCARSGSCELQDAARMLGIREIRFPRTRAAPERDLSADGISRDNDKCILCGRCVAVCSEVQGVSAISFAGRGIKTRVSTFMDRGLASSPCVQCGQCSVVCPTGAITERDDTEEIWRALAEPGSTVLVQTAPAIRASLGEALGMRPGSLVTGKMVAALRRLGFDKVFDTQFTADLTIMEEGSELISRLTKGGVLPMITSCSPGWINFIEYFYPQLLPHLSTCKSPQQMFGAIAKSYYAEKAGLDPAKTRLASIMPCTAKKHEAKRPEMRGAWEYWRSKGTRPGASAAESAPYYDVDWALTTRELARMITRAGIDIENLSDEEFDDPLGRSTGAATIFGTTGGVMEAALRTVYELVTGTAPPSIEFEAVRGLEGIKKAELDLAGTKVRVAVAHTLKNARVLLDEIAAGTSPYHFIEVMTCPGGCIGGGGQPVRIDKEKRLSRSLAMYEEDRRLGIGQGLRPGLRKSHENPAVKTLYSEFLGEPLGHLSHELLHTKYAQRKS